MATYYVSGSGNDSSGNGSSGSPWRTLAKAHSSCAAGDTIILRNGTYAAGLNINKANTTWRADTGHTPVIDGGYSAALYTGSGTGKKLPTPATPGVGITLGAGGVTLDGVTVQNIPGKGVILDGISATVKNCNVYFTYSTGMMSNKTDKSLHSLRIENNSICMTSVNIFDANRKQNPERDDQNVAGALKVGNVRGNTLIRGNLIRFGFGEGLNFGKFNRDEMGPNIIENNTVHDCNHTLMYLNRSWGVIVRNNILFHTGDTIHRWTDADVSTGLSITDEEGEDEPSWQEGKRVYAYNNLVVNTSPLFRHAAQDDPNAYFEDIYVGFNTFVGGPETGITVTGKNGPAVQPHFLFQLHSASNGLFENNIIDTRNSLNTNATRIVVGSAEAMTFRNNLWGTQPQTAHSPTDRVGDAKLGNSRAPVRLTGTYPEFVTNWSAVSFGHNFDERNYRLTDASNLAIDTATPRAQGGGFMPPVEPFEKDRLGAERDADPDMGSHESDGSPSGPPDPTVTAAFTLDHTTILAGGTVTVATNTSAATDTTITGYAWTWGDGGTATGATPSHVYTQAGVYTVTLLVSTAAGISATATATVTVQAISSGGEGNSVIVPHRAAINTATGNQTITAAALGSLVPKAALMTTSAATADGTAANGAMLCVGATDGGAQWTNVRYSANGVADSNAARRWTDDAVLMSIDGDGAVTGKASYVEFVAGGVKLNVSDGFPAAYLVDFVFFAGDDMEAWAGTATGGALGATKTVTTGIPQDAIIAVGTWGARDTATADADMSIGYATAIGQHSFRTEDRDGQATAVTRVRNEPYLAITGDSDTANYAALEARNFTATGFDLYTRSSGMTTNTVCLLAFKSATGVYVTCEALGTGATSVHTMPFQTQTVLGVLSSAITPSAASTGAEGEVMGVYVGSLHGTAEYSSSIAADHAATTMATRSLSENRFEAVQADGSSLFDGVGAINADNFTVTWSSAPASGYLVLFLAVKEGEEVDEPPDPEDPPPVAAFTSDVRRGAVRLLVQFDSSPSNPQNGGALTYAWDFGDGTTSTEANPRKMYQRPGTYTVTLTVTNANGAATASQQDYIVAEEEVFQSYLVGPDLPGTLSPLTPNYTLLGSPIPDEDGDETHAISTTFWMYEEHSEEAAVAEAEAARANNNMTMTYDKDNHRFVIVESDGTIRRMGTTT